MNVRAVVRCCVIAIAILCIAFVLGLTLFLLKENMGGSTAGTLATGRSIAADSDSISISGSFGQDTATITTSGKKIVVGPTEIWIDEKQVATIQATVAKIQIHVKNRTVTVIADDLPVDLKN